MKLFSLNEFIAQIINFILLFFILRKFLWQKFLGMLDARREKISQEFKSIEDAKAEISRLQVEYTQKLGQIEESARNQIQQAVQEGQRISDEIRQQAHKESDRIIQSAQGEIQFELKKAKQELKNTVIDLTLLATENMIREKLNSDSDKKIVDHFLAEMEQSHEK